MKKYIPFLLLCPLLLTACGTIEMGPQRTDWTVHYKYCGENDFAQLSCKRSEEPFLMNSENTLLIAGCLKIKNVCAVYYERDISKK